MLLGTLTKQPGEVLDYDIDYSEWLTSDDNVASATTAVTPSADDDDLAIELININDPRVKLWISGGVSGTTYKVTVTMETQDGRIKEDEFRMRVKEIV